MAHEWAEELAELAREHHGVIKAHVRPSRIILTREQMAAGERATSGPPRIGEVLPAGKDRWMRFDGEHWGPCDAPRSSGELVFGIDPPMKAVRGGIKLSIHPGVVKALADYRPTELELLLKKVSVENLAATFDIPIDLLRGDSDD